MTTDGLNGLELIETVGSLTLSVYVVHLLPNTEIRSYVRHAACTNSKGVRRTENRCLS